ncbi:MAG TPA: HNH endonuclease [Allosphingosinicella sp.]|nr:HNH endonuclease [Allosphingosinicella sp.]
MSLHVIDDAGRPLDAHLDLDNSEIVYHSRGGTRGVPSACNLDYGVALRLLLERAAASGHRLLGVWIDSDKVLHLPREERSILDGADLLAPPQDQFRVLSRNMQTFGRPSNAAYGGSRVKKIRITGDWPGDEDAICTILGLGGFDRGRSRAYGDKVQRGDRSGAGAAWQDDQPPADEPADGDDSIFDPNSIEDGRQKIAALIKRRQGQSRFRRNLLRAYGARCAVSGCDVEPLLEAAHIHPYRGPETNSVQNGLLLRSDLHTLFDLGLITVSSARTINVSPVLADTDYAALDGQALKLPALFKDYPSELALAWHRDEHTTWMSTAIRTDKLTA